MTTLLKDKYIFIFGFLYLFINLSCTSQKYSIKQDPDLPKEIIEFYSLMELWTDMDIISYSKLLKTLSDDDLNELLMMLGRVISYDPKFLCHTSDSYRTDYKIKHNT